MPTKRHRKTALQVPEDVPAARAALAELGEVDRRLAALRDTHQLQLQAYADALDAQLGGEIAELERRSVAITRGLEGFLLARRGDLLGKRKSVRWPEGRIGYRSGQVAVRFKKADELLIIERLRAAGLDDLLAVTTRIDKASVAEAADKLPDGLPMSVKGTERFFAAPADHDGSVDEEPER